MKQISIELENKPHELTRALGLLAERRVEIRALTVGHTLRDTKTSMVKMIVNRVDTALKAFREKGFAAEVEEIVVTPVEDHAGGLHAILRIVDGADLNIEHMYTFVSRVEGKALSVFIFDDPGRAKQILRQSGVKLISSSPESDLSADELEELDAADPWDHDVTW